MDWNLLMTGETLRSANLRNKLSSRDYSLADSREFQIIVSTSRSRIEIPWWYVHMGPNISDSSPENECGLAAPLAVQDLSLIRLDDRRGIDGLPARRVSTILSGSLYFEDLNGKTLSLRPGELIGLDASQGQIESLQLKDDIAVQFRGHVRGVVSGPADIRRSLMPNWLEWLKARQGLSLLWDRPSIFSV